MKKIIATLMTIFVLAGWSPAQAEEVSLIKKLANSATLFAGCPVTVQPLEGNRYRFFVGEQLVGTERYLPKTINAIFSDGWCMGCKAQVELGKRARALCQKTTTAAPAKKSVSLAQLQAMIETPTMSYIEGGTEADKNLRSWIGFGGQVVRGAATVGAAGVLGSHIEAGLRNIPADKINVSASSSSVSSSRSSGGAGGAGGSVITPAAPTPAPAPTTPTQGQTSSQPPTQGQTSAPSAPTQGQTGS